MGVAKREFGNIKSLLHFNFPYYGEPGDGLRDEVGVISWKNNNNAVLAGIEAPVAATFAPKFGYRCIYKDSLPWNILGTAPEGYLDIGTSTQREFEFFIHPYVVYGGSITLGNMLQVLSGDYMKQYSFAKEGDFIHFRIENDIIASVGVSSLNANEYNHVKICLDEGVCSIYINGTRKATGSYSTSLTGLSLIYLGNLVGSMDEFVMRDKVTSDGTTCEVPDKPYNGIINISGIGGTGKHGVLTLTSGTTNINTVAKIVTVASTNKFGIDYTTDSSTIGTHGKFTEGDELLIIVNLLTSTDTNPDTESGLYALRKIKSISGTTITIDEPITEFQFTNAIATGGEYVYTAHLVPNYKSVDIGSGATVSPHKCVRSGDWLGGLVAFRSQGNVTINGNILTSTYGGTRKDYYCMSHSDLPERFIYSHGGGVIILSGGTVSAPSSARIGASWDGSGKAGAAVTGKSKYGNHGGAGYGGSGGCDVNPNGDSKTCKSSAGGVGGGGAGGCLDYTTSSLVAYNGRAVGYGGRTGGGRGHSSKNLGGTQGVTEGGRGMNYQANGAGALGYTCNGNSVSGANVMIICKKLSVDVAAVSTGGQRGSYSTNTGIGGGGTGMCYLAYEEAE